MKRIMTILLLFVVAIIVCCDDIHIMDPKIEDNSTEDRIVIMTLVVYGDNGKVDFAYVRGRYGLLDIQHHWDSHTYILLYLNGHVRIIPESQVWGAYVG